MSSTPWLRRLPCLWLTLYFASSLGSSQACQLLPHRALFPTCSHPVPDSQCFLDAPDQSGDCHTLFSSCSPPWTVTDVDACPPVFAFRPASCITQLASSPSLLTPVPFPVFRAVFLLVYDIFFFSSPGGLSLTQNFILWCWLHHLGLGWRTDLPRVVLKFGAQFEQTYFPSSSERGTIL